MIKPILYITYVIILYSICRKFNCVCFRTHCSNKLSSSLCCRCLFARVHVTTYAQEIVYLQGRLNDIIEQDTSFLECKHMHMI